MDVNSWLMPVDGLSEAPVLATWIGLRTGQGALSTLPVDPPTPELKHSVAQQLNSDIAATQLAFDWGYTFEVTQ